MKSKLLIPFAPVESLLKENSKQRVSTTATESLTYELLRIGKQISTKALDFANRDEVWCFGANVRPSWRWKTLSRPALPLHRCWGQK